MSTKKAKKTVDKSLRVKLPFGKMVFVLNNLDDGQDAELSGHAENPPDLMDFLMDCVDNGLDVKLSYDSYSGGYQWTASGNWEGYSSAGHGCSGFSRNDASEALVVLWYKVVIVCQYDLSSAAGREKRTRERG